MQVKQLAIAVIIDGDKILMRKKPQGSPPYKETWYLFGTESGDDPQLSLKNYLSNSLGLNVEVNDCVAQDEEVKMDADGVEKKFIYYDFVCTFIDGSVKELPNTEKIEWISKARLMEYDIVPPTVSLFRKLGYMK